MSTTPARKGEDRVSDDKIVAKIAKNQRDVLIVSRGNFNGHEFVSLRYWVPGADGELIPTRKGLTFRPDMVADVLAAITQAAVPEGGTG